MLIQKDTEKVVSVKEFNDLVNESISSIEPLWIEGEVTNFKLWQNVMIYFSLKDEKDERVILDCNISKRKLDHLGIDFEDGVKIRVIGLPELKRSGRFTVNVVNIKLQGEGAFKKQYELTKKKLDSEGLFKRKRPIPEFIQNIGIITSKSGVVIYDFLNNLKRLGLNIYFMDSRVEGNGAVFSLTRAIKLLNERKPDLDVLIITRGGGSLEDLQAFNNEILAREIFASDIPVICGIGHDVNIPIASLVADLQVSTPSLVAVTVNKSWDPLVNKLPSLENGIIDGFGEFMKDKYFKVELITKELTSNFDNIFNKFANLNKEIKNALFTLAQIKVKAEERDNILKERLVSFYGTLLKEKNNLLKSAQEYLSAVDPRRNLKLGYSIVFDEDNRVIKDISKIKLEDIIKTKFYKGEILSKVFKKSN